MLKQIISGMLIAVVLQGTAFAGEFLGPKKKVPDGSNLKAIYHSITRNETRNPGDYDSPEAFANFREIEATGLREKTVYRSSNPIDSKTNKVRHSYADKLAREAGIQAEIDLADTDSAVEGFFRSSGARKKYCYGLYRDGKLFNVRLRGSGLYSADWPNIAEAFRFMLYNDGPYSIHCRIGRDRAGFFSMLTAALAGATVDDLRRDYMQTYCNYNHLSPKSYEYEIIRMLKADRILYYIAHPEYARDKRPMPKTINVRDIVPEEAAVNFFKTALGFSDEEILALQEKLKGQETASDAEAF